MKILSIYPYTHISSAALMINGKVVSASTEERFNRIKMSSNFPINAIEWCLSNSNLNIKDIDLIVVPWNPSINVNHVSNRWISDLKWRGEFFSHIPSHILRILNSSAPDQTEVKLGKTKIVYLNHHECHAASAFYNSPFRNSDILTIDGHGEKETCFFGYGKNTKINKLFSIDYPHSVGLLYGTITNFLGYRADSDEWKVMALASYSKNINRYDNLIKKLIIKTKTGFELNLSYFDYYNFDRRKYLFSKKFTQFFGLPRKKSQKLEKKHYEIAGALQRNFEDLVFHLLGILKKKGKKSGNIGIAGGAAMNCVMNGKIIKKNIYKNDYIPAYPDDTGVSIGALLLANYKFNKNKSRKLSEETKVYYGPEYSNDEIKKILIKNKLNFKEYDQKVLNEYIGSQIYKNKIIGWFQGQMEFGQRALGNRSIIASPASSKMKDTINAAIKYREGYRPFAPAVLGDMGYKVFDIDKGEKINFMQKAVKIRGNWRKKIPAVCHVDNTARVQTVYKKDNIKFYNLINEYYKISGIPLVVNTSFNLNGEPIVCNPEDAIRTFFTCGLDILVMGNYIIEK